MDDSYWPTPFIHRDALLAWLMPMICRTLVTSFALLVAPVTLSVADSESPSFIRFLDDDVLPKDMLESFLDARHVGEYRVVEIDTDALRQILRDAFTSSVDSETPTISLPLVDGTYVEVLLRSGGENHSGWQAGFGSFFGSISGDELSTVQCTISPDGSTSLVIRTEGKRYKLDKTAILPYHVYWLRGEGFYQQID